MSNILKDGSTGHFIWGTTIYFKPKRQKILKIKEWLNVRNDIHKELDKLKELELKIEETKRLQKELSLIMDSVPVVGEPRKFKIGYVHNDNKWVIKEDSGKRNL